MTELSPMSCRATLWAEIGRLRDIVRQRTKLLDDKLGTPCEQIRHEQEVERLREALKSFCEADWYSQGNGTYEGRVSGVALTEAKKLLSSGERSDG